MLNTLNEMNKYWLKGKEWWVQRAPREKQAMLFGVPLTTVFLVYQFLWLPYLQSVDAMRTRIKADQNLLFWMQEKDAVIRKMENRSHPLSQTQKSSMTGLSLIKKQIERAELLPSLTQLRQADNGSLALQFKDASFDKLIALILAISNEHQGTIERFTATAANSPGIVAAEIILRI